MSQFKLKREQDHQYSPLDSQTYAANPSTNVQDTAALGHAAQSVSVSNLTKSSLGLPADEMASSENGFQSVLTSLSPAINTSSSLGTGHSQTAAVYDSTSKTELADDAMFAVERGGLSRASSAVIKGTAGNDNMVGTAGNDSIVSADGNDTVASGAGNDTINAGTGNDYVDGGTGADYIVGGVGDDSLYSGRIGEQEDQAADSVFGGAGNDFIEIATGDYTNAGDGNDYIHVYGAATVVGAAGNDVVFITEVNSNSGIGEEIDWDYIGLQNSSSSGANQSQLNYTTYSNLGDGDDKLQGWNANEFVSAGNGNDWIDVGAGFNTVSAGSGNDTVLTGWSEDLVSGGDGDDLIVDFAGSDTFYGGAGNDTMIGGYGDDSLYGGDGDDVLSTGWGPHNLADGGLGNDVLLIDFVNGTVVLPTIVDIEAIDLSSGEFATTLVLDVAQVLNYSSTTDALLVTSSDSDDVLDLDLEGSDWTVSASGDGWGTSGFIQFQSLGVTIIVGENITVI